MIEFISRIFDVSDHPPRWRCGRWSLEHGWLHILSDLGVWLAYLAIPCVMAYFIFRKKNIPFRGVLLLFVAFIGACGTTHLMEAIIFWWPAYRLAGLIKFCTAVISWITVISLFKVIPTALTMRSPQELEREISERKLAEMETQNAFEELARSNQDLEQFAYVASHDLQEPLRAVGGCVQVLQKRYQGKMDARADELIAHTVDGVTRMQLLIEDLLAYSRVGTAAKTFAEADCNEILAKALANLDSAISEAGAIVTSDPLPTATVDASLMAQMLQNLIGNAIKFRGKETPKIHISAKREQREWVLSVQDNGIGIRPEFHDRIFVIFQRLHTRTEYAGTGIGLAICKKIIERHGGRIWVRSEPGAGSTFHFTIPDKE